MNTNKSHELFNLSSKIIASGTNTIVFDPSKKNPGLFFVKSAQGSHITDIDGNEYVDFICGYGTHVFGHSYEPIKSALTQQLQKGTLYCLSTEEEVRFCELLVESSPCIDQVRLMSSGTEAVMSAVRLAKYYTNRTFIVKFQESYHGHADSVLGRFYSQAGRGSFGIEASIYDSTIIARYNDTQQLEEIFSQFHDSLAAVILEPIACNLGLVEPTPEFLTSLRSLCSQYNTLLIFDEVITGFRFNYGAVANQLNIQPDLITFGKAVGGGMPIGVYGGKKEFMRYHDSHLDGFHFAGTFSGHPLTMAAGLAVCKELQKGIFYQHVESLGIHLESMINELFKGYEDSYAFKRKGSVFNFQLLKNSKPYAKSQQDFTILTTEMLRKGFLMTTSQNETMYISHAHTKEELQSFAPALFESFVKDIIS